MRTPLPSTASPVTVVLKSAVSLIVTASEVTSCSAPAIAVPGAELSAEQPAAAAVRSEATARTSDERRRRMRKVS